MNLDENKEELRFAHKLEKKRIWLNRILGLATIVLVAVVTGYAAYRLAPLYAHELKLKEFEYQRKLEILKLWETSQIVTAMEGFWLTDSLHRVTYQTYKEAVNGFELRGDDANFAASVRALRDATHKLSDVTRNYSIYWDEDFSKQAQLNALIFQGIAEMRKNDWKQFDEFVWELITIRYALQLEIVEQKIRGQNQPIRVDLFRLTEYDSRKLTLKGKRDYNIEFLKNNYKNWLNWNSP